MRQSITNRQGESQSIQVEGPQNAPVIVFSTAIY